jgi:hypothetical protein
MQAPADSTNANTAQTLPQAITDFSEKFWPVLQKALASNNPITFHKCCFTFTGRKKTASAGHPAGESVSARWFVVEHSIQNRADLAATLLHISQTRQDNLKDTVPTRNKDHVPRQPLRKRKPQTVRCRFEVLAKEFSDLLTCFNHLRDRHSNLMKYTQSMMDSTGDIVCTSLEAQIKLKRFERWKTERVWTSDTTIEAEIKKEHTKVLQDRDVEKAMVLRQYSPQYHLIGCDVPQCVEMQDPNPPVDAPKDQQ